MIAREMALRFYAHPKHSYDEIDRIKYMYY